MAVAQPNEAGAEAPPCATIEEWFAALEAPLLTYALRLLADPILAEDMVQEAFMRLHTQFDQVREPKSWLYRTVHNLALNHRRQAGKIVALTPAAAGDDEPASEPPDPLPSPDEELVRVEGIGLVRRGLQNLSARDQELLRLKFNEALSYKEISARTGLTVGHVGYLLHHSLKSLAAELAKAGLVL